MSNEEVGSPAFSLNTSDLVAVGKNAVLVGIAAVLTYLGDNIGKLDLGAYSALVVPIVVVAINTATKWVRDNTATAKK
jgi:hypothetical protein